MDPFCSKPANWFVFFLFLCGFLVGNSGKTINTIVCCFNNPRFEDGRPQKGAVGRSTCAALNCKAGRECIFRDGFAVCACIRNCPNNHNLICGSDGVTYPNHCSLHREACVGGRFLSLRHKGPCKNATVKQTEDQRPVACFQRDRDQLRSRLIAWLQSEQNSHLASTGGHSVLWFFSECDRNRDTYVDADEFLDCVQSNVTSGNLPYGERTELLRALCVDAIIDIGDRNHDWRLDYKEFQDCVDPALSPKTNPCFLEEKVFLDGFETTVECNNCVCACGHWVCTSMACPMEILGRKNGTEIPAVITRGTNKMDKDLSRNDWSAIP